MFFRARSLYSFAEWLLSAWPRLELLFLYYTQSPSAKSFFSKFLLHQTCFRAWWVLYYIPHRDGQWSCYTVGRSVLHTCCFSLVNNPVLSSFLLMEPSALEPSTVIMNGYTVIFFFGYFFERAMPFFCALDFSYIEMRCLIHSSVYSNAIF